MAIAKTIVVGAGPVGCLAAIYAANRGDDVEVYELRGGMSHSDLRRPYRKTNIDSKIFVIQQ